MTEKEIFQTNLTELMRTTKAKQIDIARYAEVSYQTVSAWVCGRGYPRAETMAKLCKFFGIKQSDLTEKKSSKKSEEETLVEIFRCLSAEGKQKMLERAEEMRKLYPLRKMKKDG